MLVYWKKHYRVYEFGLSYPFSAECKSTDFNIMSEDCQMWCSYSNDRIQTPYCQVKFEKIDQQTALAELHRNEDLEDTLSKESKILHFDSMRGCHSSRRIFEVVRKYLSDEWERQF